MIIHTNKLGEENLKRVFGLEFPEYPKTGSVTQNGKAVGYVDNFGGIKISGNAIDKATAKVTPGCVVWNPDEETKWD